MQVLTGVSYCDFMVWTPSKFIDIRIEPDIAFMESVRSVIRFRIRLF